MNKIIIQDYIEELTGDYKVLYYFGKYYVLKRLNRDGDFRASGSGKFSFPSDVEDVRNVLDYAKRVADEFNTPMISIDIAQNKKGCYLIEFQFICFGPYTIQYSDWYFEYDNNCNEWKKVDGKSDIENEIGRSLREYIEFIESVH